MSPFGNACVPAVGTAAGQLTVARVFVAHRDGSLAPLAADVAAVPTPQDQGIPPAAGDDLSPPNAVKPERLNTLAAHCVANVGFSSSKSQRKLPPSSVAYEIRVEDNGKGRYGLTAALTLEFSNPHPGESMVVWSKHTKQYINDALESELVLVDTSFADLVDGRWVDIDTDIRFSAEAEAVTRAVMETDSGQTVGKLESHGAVDEAKLGPVGERGRIRLTYQCDELHSYQEMSLGQGDGGSRDLLPIAVVVPHASMDNLAGAAQLSVELRGPRGSRSLDLLANARAVEHLRNSMTASRADGCLVLPVPTPEAQQPDGGAAFLWTANSLPPVPTCLVFWLSCREAGEWEVVGTGNIVDGGLDSGRASSAVLQRPGPEDQNFLRVSLPGQAPSAQLVRCIVNLRTPKPPQDQVRIHTDLVISDASGSTGMRTSRGGTVREDFGRLEERRFLRRLQAVPLLVRTGVLQPQDLWRQAFCVFDDGIREYWSFEVQAGDLNDAVATQLAQALAPTPADAARRASARAALAASSVAGAALFDHAAATVDKLRSLRPGGATSFTAAANHAAQKYDMEVGRGSVVMPTGKALRTTFVNWDTDGGNNCGPCYDAIKALRERADVVGGFVTGVGAWVDQDCASRTAKILGGPCSLSLDFPSDEGQDTLLRRDLHHWLQAVKAVPVTATISAGAISWRARHGNRNENAVDCLAAALVGPSEASGPTLGFELPDVTEQDHTKAVLKGLRSGQTVALYLLSRVPLGELASRLRVALSTGEVAQPQVVEEPLQGLLLGHHWLQTLADRNPSALLNRHTLSPPLSQMLEVSLSFSWNLPAPSGVTARLGRAKTTHRPPVSQEKQPAAPELVLPAEPQETATVTPDVVSNPWSNSGHPLLGASPQPAPWGGCFGSAAPAAPAASTFGGMGGGFGGGGCVNFFGSATPQRVTPASLGQGPAPAGLGYGVPMSMFAAAAPVACAAPSAGFGASVSNSSFFSASRQKKAQPNHGGGFSFGRPPPGPLAAPGPVGPSRVLLATHLLQVGPQGDAFQTALTRARYLVQQAAAPAPATAKAAMQVTEDPLVAQLLGSPAPTNPSHQFTHTGFGCDGCRALPIVGARFRSLTHHDFDLCEACFKSSHLVQEHSFIRLDSAVDALRHLLRVALRWWPVLPGAKPLPEAVASLASRFDALAPPEILRLAQLIFGPE